MTTFMCGYKYITNTATLILWLQVYYKYSYFNCVATSTLQIQWLKFLSMNTLICGYKYITNKTTLILWLQVHYTYND